MSILHYSDKKHKKIDLVDLVFYLFFYIWIGVATLYTAYEVYQSYRVCQKSKENAESENHIQLSADSINFDFTANNVLPQKVAVKVRSLSPVKPQGVDEWNWHYEPKDFDFYILCMERNKLVILPKPRKDDRVGDNSIKLYIENKACNDSAVLTIEIKGNPDLDEEMYYEY